MRLILPAVSGWLAPGGQVVARVKPQFEAGAAKVGKGGIIRDAGTHREVLLGVSAWATENDWRIHGLVLSPIKGAKGNIEFLIWLSQTADLPEIQAEAVIAGLMGDRSASVG